MRSFTTFCTLLTISLLPAWAQQDVITTAIGGGPNDIPALQSDVSGPNGVAVDTAGNLYIAAYNGNRVYKVDTSGNLYIAAYNGNRVYKVDTSGTHGDSIRAA